MAASKEKSKVKLVPLGDRIVVQRQESQEKTVGGIYLPDSAKDRPTRGKIISVGDGRVLENELPSLEEVSEETLNPSATDENLFQTLLSDIPLPQFLSESIQQISATISNSLETISNLGSEFTPEEREQAQQVVLGAIIVTQLSTARRIK